MEWVERQVRLEATAYVGIEVWGSPMDVPVAEVGFKRKELRGVIKAARHSGNMNSAKSVLMESNRKVLATVIAEAAACHWTSILRKILKWYREDLTWYRQDPKVERITKGS